MRKRGHVGAPATALAPVAAASESDTATGEAASSAEPAGVEARFAWNPLEGFIVEDPSRERDHAVLFHAGGIFAVDYRHYDRRNARDRQARLDRALVVFDGEPLEGLTFRAAVDLIGTDTQSALDELWAGYSPAPWLRVRAGLMKMSLGVEHAFPEPDLPFADYAFPAFLEGRTDWAVRVDGELGEGLLSYDFGFASGQGFDAFGQRQGTPAVYGRVTSYPLRWLDAGFGPDSYRVTLPSGFFVTFGATYGNDWEADLDVATSLRNKLFLTPRIRANTWSVYHWGYGFDAGPFRVFHEATYGSLLDVDFPDGTEDDLESELHSWSFTFSWMITGEPFDSRPFRQVLPGLAREGRGRGDFPRRPLVGAPEGREGFGAFEVAVRYTNGDIARELVDGGFTSLDVSSQEFRTFEVALDWYPVAGVRIGAQVTRVIADQFPAVFDSHGRDTSGLVRLQIVF
jgi:hypothetical protein